MPNSEVSHLQQLQTAAESYHKHGWSVIPVRGENDLNQPKAPAVAWKVYQKHHATSAERKNWFINGQGIAIVTGMISKLIVLDFDSYSDFAAFHRWYPELTHTFIVQTPRGFHVYLGANFYVKSQTMHGGDLKAEGGYVVAPPTHFGQHEYKIFTNSPVLDITPSTLRTVLKFLKPTPLPQTTHSTPTHASKDKLTHLYQEQALTNGRNNALYTTTQYAQTHNWSLDKTLTHLTPLHTHEPAHHRHSYETPAQRYNEALATIRSAYNRPARPTTHRSGGLPNALREYLLSTQIAHKEHSCATARVLDTLILSGWTAGRTFTQTQAIQACKRHKIGRRSVLSTLEARTPTYQQLIKRTTLPVGGGATRDSKQRGRTTLYYVMPSIDDLCRALGVEKSPSDPITANDLASPKAYRQAVHRALVERREGQYPREWLAERLGVSRWTIARYNRALAIVVTPVYGYFPVNWVNIDTLVAKKKPAGRRDTWLETVDGQRFPAIRGLACKLLKRGQRLTLIKQQPNYYQVGGAALNTLWRCGYCDAYTREEHPHICAVCGSGKVTHSPLQSDSNASDRDHRKVTHPSLEQTDGALDSTNGTLTHLPYLTDAPRYKFYRTKLTFQNVETVVPPDEFFEPGDGWWRYDYLWVEEEQKKYPPLRGIAYRLLKKFGVGEVMRVAGYPVIDP